MTDTQRSNGIVVCLAGAGLGFIMMFVGAVVGIESRLDTIISLLHRTH